MKLCKMIVGFLILMTSSVSVIYAQQQITQTVTAQNKNCNATCSVIDLPELNGNPGAVVFVTPNGGSPNPHPVGAYYMYLNKWSVFNLDAAALADGAKFTIEYYPNADSNHFVYIVSTNGHACIDHAGLNDNAGAQVRITAHASSTIGNLWDQYPTKVDFDSSTRRWCITNINNNPISADMAFNVAFSAGTGVITTHPGQGIGPGPLPPVNTSPGCNCVIPTSLPPNGNAGGDLTGTYPDPVVKGLRGLPISIKPPAAGQVLKWNGSAWESADDNAGPAVAPAPTAAIQTFFKNIDEESIMLDGAYNNGFPFVIHKYTVTVANNSRLVINANFRFRSDNCTACGSSQMGVSLFLNNAYKDSPVENLMANSSYARGAINNYMLDVGPGTYTIEFRATHPNIDGNVKGWVTAKYSSVMILPQ